MTHILAENSHVYCLWFVPLSADHNFFAAMIRDEEGDGGIDRALSIIEKQPWADAILP